jgi:hypothetical protein
MDETSGVDAPIALRRLLRVGNTPGSMVLRHKQAWNVFGAKVVCWRELPDDAALNSRCIILPMQGVNDPALRLPDDPEIVSAAAALQSQLLYYRLANYDKVNARTVELHESLPPRKRELYFALATPCVADKDSRHFLLNYFRDRHSHAYSDDSLSAAEYSVLFALFHVAHLPEHRGHPLTKEIAARANRHLHEEREHFNCKSGVSALSSPASASRGAGAPRKVGRCRSNETTSAASTKSENDMELTIFAMTCLDSPHVSSVPTLHPQPSRLQLAW